MREKINSLRHLGVLFLTVIVFFLGVFISGNVEDLRVESLYNQLQEQDLEYQNIVTESSYIEFLLSQKEKNSTQYSCEQLEKTYFTSIDNLDEARKDLESYISTASKNEEEFSRLESHYANTQINYLMLAQRFSQICKEKINTVVYFYSDDDDICPSCEDQGVYLTHVKQKLQDKVLVFSFDVNKEGPVQLLKTNYNVSVTSLPRVVVNGEKMGFSTSDEVLNLLCEQGLNDSVCR